MPNYRRQWNAGGVYFFTLVTHQRRGWLCHSLARQALREAIQTTRHKWPFEINAWVLLPDHLHCIWTLPDDDTDYATRWRLIKQRVSHRCASMFETETVSASRIKRGERAIWQRRFWEHVIRDVHDYRQHCDYIHYNPVKHQLCRYPLQWPYSTFRKFVNAGIYSTNWGMNVTPELDDVIGRE